MNSHWIAGSEPDHLACDMPLELRNPEFRRGFSVSDRDGELSEKVSRFLTVMTYVENPYVEKLAIADKVLEIYWPNMTIFDVELLLEGCRMLDEMRIEREQKMQQGEPANGRMPDRPGTIKLDVKDKWR